MAAAAFKASMTFQAPNGSRWSRYCTVSDVAAAYYVFQDGNGFITMPADGVHTLVDVTLSAAGTEQN